MPIIKRPRVSDRAGLASAHQSLRALAVLLDEHRRTETRALVELEKCEEVSDRDGRQHATQRRAARPTRLRAAHGALGEAPAMARGRLGRAGRTAVIIHRSVFPVIVRRLSCSRVAVRSCPRHTTASTTSERVGPGDVRQHTGSVQPHVRIERGISDSRRATSAACRLRRIVSMQSRHNCTSRAVCGRPLGCGLRGWGVPCSRGAWR